MPTENSTSNGTPRRPKEKKLDGEINTSLKFGHTFYQKKKYLTEVLGYQFKAK